MALMSVFPVTCTFIEGVGKAVSLMSFCNGHCDSKLLRDGLSTNFH